MHKRRLDEHLVALSNSEPMHTTTVSKTFLKLARQTGYIGAPNELGVHR